MLHNKQYILSRKIHRIDDSWQSVNLQNGWYISYQQNLHIAHNDDNSIILLGDAWQVEPKRQDPIEIIRTWNEHTSLDEMFAQEETWNGRYLIITSKYILTDTTSSLTCFYNESNDYSSSLSLLQIIYSKPIIELPDMPELCPAHADFMPGRLTQYNDCYRLLPNQIINYLEHIVSYRKLYYPTPKYTKEQCLDEFEKVYLHSVNEMVKHYKDSKIWLAISGGYDSRTCLAALENVHADYSLYTLYNPKAVHASCYADYKVSQKISKAICKPLVVRVRKPKNKEMGDEILYQQYRLHSSGMTLKGYAMNYASEQNALLGNGNNVMINNAIWEIVADHYGNHHYMHTIEAILSSFELRGEFFKNSILDWANIVNADTKNSSLVSISMASYWELRDGCWASDLRQAGDIDDKTTTILSFNCRKFVAILLNLEYEYRSSKEFEKDLANRWCPQLKTIPYDGEYYDFWTNLKSLNIYAKCVRIAKRCFIKSN